MNININKNNVRYIKSKYNKLLAGTMSNSLLIVLNIVIFAGAVALIVFSYWYGWLILIIPTQYVMIHEWWKHSLRNIPPKDSSDLPVDIISSEVLAAIKTSQPSQEEFVKDLQKTKGLWFMANRFGLHPDHLASMSLSDNWWQKAVELWKSYPVKDGVDSAHIVAAMVLTSPDANSVLSVSKNKPDDLLDALQWYGYIQELLSSLHKRGESGGIARDWATGYTQLLNSYATNISRSIQYGQVSHREIIGHTSIVNQMQTIFSSNGRSNIALVGEEGVGRSTCIQAFAERLLFGKIENSELRYNQIFQIDMANLLTSIKPEELERTIQLMSVEAYHAKNIILYFDNAGAFFGSDGSRDITEIILPIIESGGVRMIFSFTPNHWQYLQKNKPQVVALLNYQIVQPTDAHDTLKILENQSLFTESQYKCMFTYQSLKEAYRLADRYGPEIAMPGRAISVLEDAGRSAQGGLVHKVDVQHAVEQSTGIKISTADTSEKNVLQNLEAEIKKRVIGQDDAVREITSSLKRSRAGVANPNKPIGTFLFLGPTGVGKTELSKTLAKTYFGGDSGMVRVDMNEYITQDSVNQLINGNSQYGTSFLESVRKQPFSVILFDEIEKAHPDIVNTLLQMLDEGFMKDSDNRTVSFKDAIIIATSNAGADIIRDEISKGSSVADLENHLTDDLITRGIFKPEFVNRFDDAIIFSPLSTESLGKVVAVLLVDINTQLSEQGVKVALTDDAVEWLVSRGYDERLGARPLRRMMQKSVETAVSDVLLEQDVAHGSTITLNAEVLAKTVH